MKILWQSFVDEKTNSEMLSTLKARDMTLLY